MKNYYWKTEDPHFCNNQTMSDWIDNHMPNSWDIDLIDGTVAFVTDENDQDWQVHASGNGDSYRHMVEFVKDNDGRAPCMYCMELQCDCDML